MNTFTKRRPPIRSQIDLCGPMEIRCWTKALGVSAGDLKKLIEKVGNSASAVRKEIEHSTNRV